MSDNPLFTACTPPGPSGIGWQEDAQGGQYIVIRLDLITETFDLGDAIMQMVDARQLHYIEREQ